MLRSYRTVIGYPTNVAAALGNAEMLSLLFEHIPDSPPKRLLTRARELGTECSAESKFATFQLCQDREPSMWYSEDMIRIIERTLSHEIFEYMEIVCGVYIQAPCTRPRKNILMMRLENCFRNAVTEGNLDMMKYLVSRGVVIKDLSAEIDKYESTREFDVVKGETYLGLTSRAALGGYTDVLQYLLENGAIIGCRSLEAACNHGNPGCVRLLLEDGATNNFKPGSALLECVKNENEPVIRQLVTSGMASVMGMDDNVKQQIQDVIEKEGLVSFSKRFNL
jgi:hypothetical protein